MPFFEIAPNLRRLGLLAPCVRAACDKPDLLRFDGRKDSVDEPARSPEELVQLLSGLLVENNPESATVVG